MRQTLRPNEVNANHGSSSPRGRGKQRPHWMDSSQRLDRFAIPVLIEYSFLVSRLKTICMYIMSMRHAGPGIRARVSQCCRDAGRLLALHDSGMHAYTAFCFVLQADNLVPVKLRSTRLTFCLQIRCLLFAPRQIRSRSGPQGIARKSFARTSDEADGKLRLCPRDAEFLESAHFIHRGM